MNRTALGSYGNWASYGAMAIAIALAVGLVRGKSWTQAHSVLGGTAVALYVISKL